MWPVCFPTDVARAIRRWRTTLDVDAAADWIARTTFRFRRDNFNVVWCDRITRVRNSLVREFTVHYIIFPPGFKSAEEQHGMQYVFSQTE